MNKWNNDDGFTLLEMLIVMIIITILILLIVPNIAKQSEGIHSSGCEALVQTVQTQVQAYQLEEKSYPPTLNALKDAGYINDDHLACQNGTALNYDGETGHVWASAD